MLATGEKIIAETTTNDYNWGIGMDIGDHRMRVPALWAENEAFNILGFALMKARSRLAEDKDDDAWNAYKSEVPEVK